VADPIAQRTQEAEAEVLAADSAAGLAAVETKYLGRKGSLNELRRAIGTLPADARPAFGARINEAVETLTARIAARRAELEAEELDQRLAAETLDVTLPGRPLPAGRLHPLTQTAQRVKQARYGMGFEFVDGPELEDYQ
jgi:phenylalanyl-tRNA synthetase alpha chain